MKRPRQICFGANAKTYWAGFVEDAVDLLDVDTGWGGWGRDGFAKMPALFETRDEARRRYERVVKVRIELVE